MALRQPSRNIGKTLVSQDVDSLIAANGGLLAF